MKKNRLIFILLVLVLVVGGYFAYEYVKFNPPNFLIKLLTSRPPAPPLPAGDVAPLTVPAEFSATIFARDIPGARVMTRDPKGAILVSLTEGGKIVALHDINGDGKTDKTVVVLENLKQPHGIVVDCTPVGNPCTLYVAETGELKAYRYDDEKYAATYVKTVATFPSGDGHFTRTLLMHPDGTHLLVSIGSSCNTCRESDSKRASVQIIDLTTGKVEEFASGLRNSVFMALDPVAGEIWATENSRDLIGDDIPPDEINIIKKGNNYGWPLCYGKNIHDTDFDKKQYTRDPCADMTPSYIDLQAHSAALGLAFVPEEGWAEEWRSDLLVAFHGSWNRSEPTGYKVVRINLDDARKMVGAPVDFVTGFLAPGAKTDTAIGRPVGLMAEPGGTVYLSDDRAGAIYKISLKEMPY